MYRYRLTLNVVAISCLLFVAACDDRSAATARLEPVAIEHGDECHVCGMLILNYPGPKGEAFERGQTSPRKFCSTRDLFAYLLQPETQALVREIYVHDMTNTSWMQPLTASLIDAQQAWYVVNQPLRGAMGPTLATFAKRESAEAFIKTHGGRLLQFADIDLQVIAELDYGDSNKQVSPDPGQPAHH